MDPEEVRQDWAERSGRFSPTYYAQLGPNHVSEILVDVLDHYLATDAEILEIGCGCGRHLEALRRRGFANLVGVDINEEAIDVIRTEYPHLAETGTFHVGPIEDLVDSFADRRFAAVYSVETFQHIHPSDEWVFDAIGELTNDLLITAENEGNSPDRGRAGEATRVDGEVTLYFRDWKQEFTDRGFAQLVVKPTNRDTVRVFRRL